MAKKKKKSKIDAYIDALHRLDNKTVIITGANSGIGFEIARTALLKGARVVMACRDNLRAIFAKEKLIQETGLDNIIIEKYDQSDIESIHHLANIIIKDYSDFYALVLNAGIFLPEQVVDEYHISNVYKTNYLGPMILLSDLKTYLDESDIERRVIFQSSLGAYYCKYKNKDRLIYGEDKPMRQYCLSKLGVTNLFAYYRDNNQNPNIKFLLCEPGVAFTNLFRNFKKWFKKIAYPFLRNCCSSPKEGSLSACKELCDVMANGNYYRPRCFLSTRGLPKLRNLPNKLIKEDIIKDGIETIKNYE